MSLRIIASLSRRLHQMTSDMESLTMLNSRERIVGYLLREMADAKRVNGKPLTFKLRTPKAVTASLLNLTPETFSRVIHGLEKENIILLSGRSVTILDLERLRARGSL